MHNAPLVRRIVAWSLIAVVGLPPPPVAASGGRGHWSRVEALKPNTHILLMFVPPPEAGQPGSENRDVVEGWFVSASPDDLVLYGDGRNVTLTRERIVEVGVVRVGRHWYAIPLVVAAVAGGIVLCLGTLGALAESGSGEWPSGDDSQYGWLTVFAVPVLMGVWAYRKSDSTRRSVKVIYQAPPPVGPAGL